MFAIVVNVGFIVVDLIFKGMITDVILNVVLNED